MCCKSCILFVLLPVRYAVLVLYCVCTTTGVFCYVNKSFMCFVLYCVLHLLYYVDSVCIVYCVYCTVFIAPYYNYTINVVQALLGSCIVCLILCVLSILCVICVSTRARDGNILPFSHLFFFLAILLFYPIMLNILLKV